MVALFMSVTNIDRLKCGGCHLILIASWMTHKISFDNIKMILKYAISFKNTLYLYYNAHINHIFFCKQSFFTYHSSAYTLPAPISILV